MQLSSPMKPAAGAAAGSTPAPSMVRKDFLGSCAPQPRTLAVANPTAEEHFRRMDQFMDEARQSQEQRSAWQEKVGADLGRVAEESSGLKSSLASMERQLCSMKALLQQKATSSGEVTAEGNMTAESKWGRLQQTSAKQPAGETGAQRALDVDSGFQTVRALISETSLRLETGFERQIVALDGKVGQQLDFIYKSCAELLENNVRIESLFSEHVEFMQTGANRDTEESSERAPTMGALYAPGGDPLAALGTESQGGSSHPSGGYQMAAVLDRTSVMPQAAGATKKLQMGTRAVLVPEVAQCIFVMQLVSFWLIVAYIVFVGLSLSLASSFAKKGEELPTWMHIGNMGFLVAFVMELALRLSLEKKAFFIGRNRNWNALDFVLTVLQVIEVFELAFFRISLARIAKLFKVLRVLQLFKMKQFRGLRLIVSIAVWRPLLWGTASLMFLTYAFSLFFAQIVTNWLIEEGHNTADPALLAELDHYYGTLRHTMVSLFMAFTGGELWGVLLRPLKEISPWCEPAFVIYILITTCGMMNILGALFVDMVLFTSNRDHDIQMTQREKRDRELVHELKELMQAKDHRKTGRVSREAVMAVVTNKENKKFLKELGVEVDNVKSLFKLLDVEERNRVSVDEFCYGMLNMSSDVHFARNSMLMFQSKRTLDKLDLVAQVVGNRLHKLEKLIIESSARREVEAVGS